MSQSLKIHEGAIVEGSTTVLRGEIEIGKGTIIHPTVQIHAENGPIEIGRDNLIEEGVIICNKSERKMVIGNENVFEIRSYSEATSIGNNNLLQMKARLCSGSCLGDGCVVGTGVELENKAVEDRTHIYTLNGQIVTRIVSENPPSQSQQLDFLRNTIPNYHKIRKPTNA